MNHGKGCTLSLLRLLWWSIFSLLLCLPRTCINHCQILPGSLWRNAHVMENLEDAPERRVLICGTAADGERVMAKEARRLRLAWDGDEHREYAGGNDSLYGLLRQTCIPSTALSG
ncbi:hypothetical protein EDD85DRAFT_794368 [Armillaria nabsnona]|nr:hypothetical protein EDD85DRAFT_794368 [Armillaria nabsnona]